VRGTRGTAGEVTVVTAAESLPIAVGRRLYVQPAITLTVLAAADHLVPAGAGATVVNPRS
ncbi:hypothetical protein ACGFZQ_43400, partial [Streptomyces sp. NPDC048254]|uniref:hypothetical protein n=1 Tax=Streptomyces sp. NPDC048254 TaxID=3365525 RepID=UPI00371C9682